MNLRELKCGSCHGFGYHTHPGRGPFSSERYSCSECGGTGKLVACTCSCCGNEHLADGTLAEVEARAFQRAVE